MSAPAMPAHDLPPAVALDLDGVVWRAATPIAGAAGAVERLRTAGVEVVFVTNNAWPTVAEHEAKLARFGIDAGGAVISSPMAAAALLTPGERVLAAGGPGVREAIERAGAVVVSYEELDRSGAEPVTTVVVGFHRDFDYDRMRIASTAVRNGARLVATNDDATYPTEHGEIPGNGSILAGIATAAGVAPVIAGKPHDPIAELVRRRCGPTGLVIGDRPDTDGRFARTLGWPFGLVLSGVTRKDDLPALLAPGPEQDPAPELVADDLAGLVDQLLD